MTVDFNYESDKHLAAYYAAELRKIAQGEKSEVDPRVITKLSRAGLIIRLREQKRSKYQVTDKAFKLLREARIWLKP